MDLAANLKATRDVGPPGAGRLWHLRRGGRPGPRSIPTSTTSKRPKSWRDCYQLLLILAETEAAVGVGPAAGRAGDQHLRGGALPRAGACGSARRRGPGTCGRRATWPCSATRPAARREEKAADDAPVRQRPRPLPGGRRAVPPREVRRGDQGVRRGAAPEAGALLGAVPRRPVPAAPAPPAEARAGLGACLAQRPDFVWLYLLRGFAQGELMAFDAADADFQKAVADASRRLFPLRALRQPRRPARPAGPARRRHRRAEGGDRPEARRVPGVRQPGPGLPPAEEAGPGPRTAGPRRPARAGAGPPLPPARPAAPGAQGAGPGPQGLRPGHAAARAPTTRCWRTTTSSAAGCCSPARKYAEALESFDAALGRRKDHSRRSACGPRRCSSSGVTRKSSTHSTTIWRRASRWSRSTGAAAWPGRSWASTPGPSRISRGRWS